MKVVLLGDSIFDNKAYVGTGEPDVRAQVQALLPLHAQAVLLAVDGDKTHDIARQLQGLPTDATHLVMSIGGNDVLGRMYMLQESAQSVAEVVLRMAREMEDFERTYAHCLQAVLQHQLPTAVCTIYYPRFPDDALQRLSVTALSIYNDCIIRLAVQAGIPLIDLRLICISDSDYANPIEPSSKGGAKIASAVVKMLNEHNFSRNRTEVFASP